MSKKINRADLLTALYQQVHAQNLTDEPFILKESIQPTIDISRPSKIPYQDWVGGVSAAASATMIPKKAGRRVVVTHIVLSAMNTSTGTGTLVTVAGTVNGVGIYFMAMAFQSLTAAKDSQTVSCEIVVDVNTDVVLSSAGAFDAISCSVLGYYIDA